MGKKHASQYANFGWLRLVSKKSGADTYTLEEKSFSRLFKFLMGLGKHEK